MRTLIVNGSPVNNGATAELVKIIASCLQERAEAQTVQTRQTIQTVCLGDLDVQFCKGCKTCYETATCFQDDGVAYLFDQMDQSDNIVFVVPSYWADVPGQLKTFFDRCTPYSNTNPNPLHKRLSGGKKGYAVSLRTGAHPVECEHIIESIKHYCGHMEIEMCDSFYMCEIKDARDVIARKDQVIEHCSRWIL